MFLWISEMVMKTEEIGVKNVVKLTLMFVLDLKVFVYFECNYQK